MKKIILLFTGLFSASLLIANINFVVDYATFMSPNQGPYVEFYLTIKGNSISYAQKENKLYQSNVEITYLIEKGEEVIAFQKFLLKSPEYKLEDIKPDLLNLKRLAIKEGNFKYTVIVKDLINGNSAEASDQLRPVNYSADKIEFSEIQLANSLTAVTEENPFVKSGYDIVPNVSHTYGISKNELVLYTEVYKANKSLAEEAPYLVDISIKDAQTNEVSADLRVLKRMKATAITPIIQSFSLENLRSGEYNLVVEARNRQNEVMATKQVSFIRVNSMEKEVQIASVEGSFVDSIRDTEILTQYIKCLYPISSDEENRWADNQLKFADLEYMQKFFLNFWQERNKLDPESAWLAYKEQVDFVNEEFGYGNVSGYTTERGRIYLQYGAPNVVRKVPYDRDTYPYSVWQYYELDGMTDRKFIFYSPSMEMLGYQVLHSNVRGEIQNPNWEYELISKSTIGKRTNEEVPTNTIIQREARDLFDNPR